MNQRTWSELDVIRLFSNYRQPQNSSLAAGIGDDCAVFAPSAKRDYLVTADMLVEQVHFDLSFHPPYFLGRKCMAVNLSDIAAMGGKPEFALLSMSIPDRIDNVWLNEFSDGVNSILQEHECVLIGGDTVRGDSLTLGVTVIGSVLQNEALMRDGAAVGDSVYVSGPLGSAAIGLAMCQREDLFGPPDKLVDNPFVQQHLNPGPEIGCGRILAASKMVTSMQDLSDGLATDLAHICRSSDVGAVIRAEMLPGLPEFPQVCRRLVLTPEEVQVAGGEDYRLVFTVASGQDRLFMDYMTQKTSQEVYRIGSIVESPGVILVSGGQKRDISFQGYTHGGEP